MYFISKCYKCGHYAAFQESQKTVLCRRCNKTLECKNMHDKFYKVNDAASAGKLIAKLESEGKVVGFGTYK